MRSDLDSDEIVALVSTNTGVPGRLADISGQLRAKGHDVIAVIEDPALVGTPDEELLVHAPSSGRFPSDRSFVGGLVKALEDMIVTGQLPADGAKK